MYCSNWRLALLELRRCELSENAVVESLESELHSRQDTQEFQQPIYDLESKLTVTLSDITAKQTEFKSLETECQKLTSSVDNDVTEKITSKR